MYPRLNEGVSLEQIELDNGLHYYIKNTNGDQFELSHNLYDALQEADETKAIDLNQEDEQTLLLLRDYKLISNSHLIKGKCFIDQFILFSFDKNKQPRRGIFKVLNVMMIVLTIALTIAWAYVFANSPRELDPWINTWTCIVSSIVGMMIHEVGQIIAAFASGYTVTNVGVMLLFRIIPVGCYCDYEIDKVTTKTEAIQFYLAGTEMNLILAYIASIIGLTKHSLCGTANIVAFFNFGMALLSVLPIKNSVGENVISILCEVKSINDEVKRWFSSKEYRWELLHSGSKGIRRLIAIVIALILQIAYWVLTALVLCLLVVPIVYAFYVIVTL
ncbi:MAG: hypothetical protein LUC38_03365 [Oscillospiraceae bacterium]|nr:hypothetical protein [Oscillospiraceae bacterium]